VNSDNPKIQLWQTGGFYFYGLTKPLENKGDYLTISVFGKTEIICAASKAVRARRNHGADPVLELKPSFLLRAFSWA